MAAEFRPISSRSSSSASAAATRPGLAVSAPGSGLRSRSYAQAHGGELLYVPLRPHGSRFELIVPVGNAYASPVQTG
jgi:hypothetical protein